jgi:hypothetical protein
MMQAHVKLSSRMSVQGLLLQNRLYFVPAVCLKHNSFFNNIIQLTKKNSLSYMMFGCAMHSSRAETFTDYGYLAW